MWQKIKTFLLGVAAGVGGAILFLLGKNLHDHRKPVDDVGRRLDECKEGSDRIADGIRQAAESIDDALGILDSVKKTGKEK